MEHQLWKAIVEWLRRYGKPRKAHETFSDVEIAKVWFWSVSWTSNRDISREEGDNDSEQ